MIRILGKASSINVRKVLWTCAEIGIPFARENWGSGFAATDTPAFLRLNPNGLVPVIKDENGVLWESNTICRYLAAKHDRIDLLPAEPWRRAQVERWMDWQATDLNAAWREAFVALVRKDPSIDPARISGSAGRWNAMMGILDRQLATTRAFVAGPEFTLADIVIGLSVNRWLMTPIERPALDDVAAYVRRLEQRPGWLAYGANGVP